VNMVSFSNQVPDELLRPDRREDLLAYLRQVHGDIEDAKVTLLQIADEQDFEVEPEDIETVTDSDPVETFT